MRLTQNQEFHISLDITGCRGIEWPFYSSKILTCNNLELLHAILTCGMPSQFLSPWHPEKRTQEFISKISVIENNLLCSDGYLTKSSTTEFLDPSEKSVNAYYIGLFFTKLFSMKEFEIDYFLHTSLFEQIYGSDSFSCSRRKKPSFIGYCLKDHNWSAWESTGRRDYAPKALDDAYNQVLAVKTINKQLPGYSMACMTYFDSKNGELQATLRNSTLGKKADILFDREHFLTLYYQHICEIFDESLRRKPFDSVIDYIDGYLEIELELFGLNMGTDHNTGSSQRHRVKLGIPKEILGYFQYKTDYPANMNSISSIIDSLNISLYDYQDDAFYMGRDGIYLRIV